MNAGAGSLKVAVRRWLDRPGVESDLNEYFAEPHRVVTGLAYAGRFFERLDGGGDRPEVCDRFTAADLVAVQMLSVNVPPEASIAILHGDLGRRLSQLLRLIPTDVRLGDPEASEHVREDTPAQKAWTLLERENGAGYVTAGKLMARKRPHLVPVYDSVVKCALEEPTALWSMLHTALAEPEADVRERLAELRSACQIPAEVGDLRLLDVAVWKGHRRHHRRTGCTAPGTTSLMHDPL